MKKGFESRVNLAIDGEPVPAAAHGSAKRGSWWRPLAGAAVVTGVAVVAVTAMQQRSPLVSPAPTAALVNGLADANREAISYTVPAASKEVPIARPSARLTSYLFAHSKYSYGLGQRSVLTDLLINDEEPAAVVREPAAQVPVSVAP